MSLFVKAAGRSDADQLKGVNQTCQGWIAWQGKKV